MAAVGGSTQQRAASQTAGPPNATPSGAADRCFPGDGYEFAIGNQGPTIDVAIHMSMLTNLGGPGTFGVELAGSTGSQTIIELRIGVVFDGIDDVGTFLNDPFGAFAIAFDYQFQLPMFGSGFDHNATEAPIDGPIDQVDC
jgi:hypothetical protein